MAPTYYNELDPVAAHVLRTLIEDGVIAPGVVDTRSIKEVAADDIKGFTQCHFFAGGGLWSVAARIAGWPDDRPIWTGSCPCQPFSVAGKGGGVDDPRHLWPDFFRLIRAARPPVVMGEQVAKTAGYGWFDGVAADLESEGFACRAVDIPACAVDAPHIRSRLYWYAMEHRESIGRGKGRTEPEIRGGRGAAPRTDAQGALGDGIGARLERHPRHGDEGGGQIASGSAAAPDGCDMGDRPGVGREQGGASATSARYRDQLVPAHGRNGSFWSDAGWITCHDGKARRAQPDIRLLANGVPGRVDLWRIAGNAIVPQLAAEAIRALMETLPEWREGA